MYSRSQAALMDDRVAGITGHVKHAEIWSLAHGGVGELPAIDAAGHHHVSEQQIDMIPSAENLERSGAVARARHVIAKFLQNPACVFSQSFVVFDNENPLRARPLRELV